MGKWIVMTVSGICSSLSFYMSLLAFRLGDSGAFLFAGFGLFFGVLFVVSAMGILAGKGIYKRGMNGKDKISGSPKPVSFVPHRFIMLALIVTAIAVLAAIFIPIFFQGN